MKTRKNFTLIELLVVIAIIAILASMLLPALNQARNKAKDIKCTSNMKQLMTATLLYTDDFGGYYPCDGNYNRNQPFGAAAWSGSPPYAIRWWSGLIYSYVIGKQINLQSGYYMSTSGRGFSSTPYSCPRANPEDYGKSQIALSNKIPYGINRNFTYGKYGAGNACIWTKASNISAPSTTVYLSDSFGNPAVQAPGVGGPIGAGDGLVNNVPALRHGQSGIANCLSSNKNRANSGFADGHVAPLSFGQMRENSAYLYKVTK